MPYYDGYCAISGCACAEHTSGHGLFRSRHFRSREWRHFRWKGYYTADIAQLPVPHAQSILSDMASSDHVTSGHVSDVISCENSLLRRILGNFRLRMRRTYFWTWPFPLTSLPVTWMTSFPVKRPLYGRYCATSGSACAEHTLGHGLFRARHFRSREWRHFRWKAPRILRGYPKGRKTDR